MGTFLRVKNGQNPAEKRKIVRISKYPLSLISADSYGAPLLYSDVENLNTHKDSIVLFRIRHCKILFALKYLF